LRALTSERDGQVNESSEAERAVWIRHARRLALGISGFHAFQFASSLVLWRQTDSAVIAAFGLDAAVSACGALGLALGIRKAKAIPPERASGSIGYGYVSAAILSVVVAAAALWRGLRPGISLWGIGLAALSMLAIPIMGSYLKVLAVELRSQPLKSAAIFTFGNSYLALVLLVGLLLNAGMDLGWGEAAAALVTVPFMAQKGIQILLEEERPQYAED